MSITMHLRRLSNATLSALEKDPEWKDFLPDDRQNTLALDKAWHGLHFLLNAEGVADARLRFLNEGGRPVRSDSDSYGPARAFHATDVAVIAAALADQVTSVALMRRFDLLIMNAQRIYPSSWDENPDEQKEYLLHFFERLKAFLLSASTSDEGILIVLE